MTDETIPRRKFLVGAGLAGTAVATGLTQATPAEAQAPATAGSSDTAGSAAGRAAASAQRDRARLCRRRGRHDHSGRRIVALGQRLRLRDLYRPPARQRLGRRRQNVSLRPLFQRQAGAGLSIAADAGRVHHHRHRRRQRLVAQNLRPRFRPARSGQTHRSAQGDAGGQGRRSTISIRAPSSPACWR